MQQDLFSASAAKAQKEAFFNALAGGETQTCPCCERPAKVYRRKLHGSIARQLIALYKIAGGAGVPVHFTAFANLDSGRDFTIAKHWGLIEPAAKGAGDDGKKDSGRWALTALGETFVLGYAPIPREVYLYADELRGWSNETVKIRDALGQKFNYDELMGA